MTEALRTLLPDFVASLLLAGLLALVPFVSRHIPRRPKGVARAIGAAWVGLSRRPKAAAAVLCAIQLAGVGLQAVVSGPPVPAVHDEFSYLLAGSTFARGMITNQTHPMWVHFETPHVIQTPTRMSKYPPGQGVFLAVGYLLGHPWIGVVLSTLVMIVLVYWAARQWVAPWWALLAGVFGLGTVLGTYWTGSYWGGALNAAAGALVAGSAGALRRRSSKEHLALFALGACLCAATRPYEGLVLVASFSAWLFWRALRLKSPDLKAYIGASLPAAALSVAFAAVFLYYNYRVTGDPLVTPYSVASRQYLASKMFVFQDHPPVPEYRHEVLEKIYVGLRRTEIPFYWKIYGSLDSFRAIYMPPFLFPLFLVCGVSILRGLQPKVRPILLIAAGGGAAILLLPYINPHYYGPFQTCFILAVVGAIRGLRAWPVRGTRPGWVLLCLCLSYYAGHLATQAYSGTQAAGDPDLAWARHRQEFIRQLSQSGRKNLIIVRYAKDHDWYKEWVYNVSDIESGPVVWAREMNPAQDAEIVRYFADRKVWLLEADATPPRLTEYTTGRTAAETGRQ